MPSVKQIIQGYRIEAAVALFCCLVIVVVWTATVKRINFERASAIDAVMKQNSNLAIAFEEHTARTLKSVDQTLQFIRGQYPELGKALDLRKMIASGEIDGSIFASLGITDTKGNLVASSRSVPPVNFSKQETFRRLQQSKTDDVWVGAPTPGRVAGRVIFSLSRRITRPDGSFGGTVFAGIDPAYFTTFYEKTDLGKEGVVSLARRDGISLVRRSGTRNSYGENLRGTTLLAEQAQSPAGNFAGVGKLDRIRRFYSYRTLAQYPVIVVVGTSEQEALATFNENARDYYLRATGVSLLILLFGTALITTQLRQRRVTDQLARREILYRATFNQAAIGIAHSDFNGRPIRANNKLCDMLGYTEAELKKLSFRELTYSPDRPAVLTRDRLLAPDGPPSLELEKRYLRKDGQPIWVMVSVSLVRDPQDKPDYLITVVQDVSTRKFAEERLRKLVHAIEQSPAQTVITDVDGRVEYVNPKFTTVSGYALPELVGKTLAAIRSGITPLAVYQDMWQTILSGREWRGEIQNRKKNGELYWEYEVISPLKDEQGAISNFIAVKEDITERRELEQRLLRQAHYDGLTQLPNRVLCYDRLQQSISHAQRRRLQAGVLFIDLDHFKEVNDTLGHGVGDQLLQQAAQRLKAAVRAEDTAGRLGGDEFLIILSEIADGRDCRAFAQKLIATLAQPFELAGRKLTVTASIGIATYPEDGDNVDTLIRNADAAMFRAKSFGRNCYHFYGGAANSPSFGLTAAGS
jgi:diguanylate cyclase (GGDEF)-like protein/PAS domain S-box-containing protein